MNLGLYGRIEMHILLGRVAVLHVRASYCCRPSSVVCRSVCRSVTVMSLQKRLNRSRCRLSYGLGWAQWIMCILAQASEYLVIIRLHAILMLPGYGWLLQMEKRDLSVGLSACWSACHNRELCKNGWTDRDVVWYVDSGGSKEACIRRLSDRVVTCCTQDKATTTSQPFVIPLLSTVRQPTRPHITATVVFVISRSLNSGAYPTGYKLKETYTPKIAKIGPNSWCRICC